MDSDDFVALSYDKAMAGLDLVVDGRLRPDRADMHQPLTFRFIERLLDQLDEIGRPPTPSEHTLLLRAIRHLRSGDFHQAFGNAWHASQTGNTPLFGGIEEPDLSINLRAELAGTNSR